MIYLISHVTCLNNTCGWSYELPHNEFVTLGYKLVYNSSLQNGL